MLYKIQSIIDSGSFANVYLLKCLPKNVINNNDDDDNNNDNNDSGCGGGVNIVENDKLNISDPQDNLNKFLKLDIENHTIKNTPTDKIILKHGTIPYVEKEFLYSLQTSCPDFIVHFLGHISHGIFTNEISLLFEYADCNLQYYFDEKILRTFKHNNIEYKNFLKNCKIFFDNVLEFLNDNNYVYGDWKLENILVFYRQTHSNSINNTKLKLTDFGSLMKMNEKITNLKNLNIMYSSPMLSNLHDEITPNHFDDIKSVCWLFWTLNNKKLPWEYLNLNYQNDVELEKILLEIDKMKLNLFKNYFFNVSECVYWPNYNTNDLVKVNENTKKIEFLNFNLLNN